MLLCFVLIKVAYSLFNIILNYNQIEFALFPLLQVKFLSPESLEALLPSLSLPLFLLSHLPMLGETDKKRFTNLKCWWHNLVPLFFFDVTGLPTHWWHSGMTFLSHLGALEEECSLLSNNEVASMQQFLLTSQKTKTEEHLMLSFSFSLL